MPNLPSSKDCCGCAACIDICPKKALSLVEDNHCFYNVVINNEDCIDCGLCEKHCHILHPERLRKSDPRKVEPIAAWSTNEELIKHSATGAIFAQIACNMLEEGNTYVYGAALQEDSTVHHIEISNVKHIRLLQNSKYQQSYCVGIYAKIKKRLREGARVLFSGVPCQVAALYSFLQYDKNLVKNLYTIEVICHGVPCNDIHRTSLKANKATKIYAYRNKDNRGWCGPNGNNNRLSYIDEDGNRYMTTSFQKDSLFRSYLSFNFTRENCYECPYSDILRVADLTIGDFWGWDHTPNPDKYKNYWGTSIVLRNTDKGLKMMSMDNLVCVNTTWKEFLPFNQNLYMPSNLFDYKGAKLMPLIKQLPVCVKNTIYQNGFFNAKFDHLFYIFRKVVFGRKHTKAMLEKNRKIDELLKFLNSKS